MECHDAKERLREERLTAAVRRHLARCEDCSSFVGELEAGGRQIGEAFLAGSPSPGFEDRVTHRLAEREIAVSAGGPRRVVPFLVAALLLLTAGAGAMLFGRKDAPSSEQPLLEQPAESTVVTRPIEENILALVLDRETSSSPTRLELDFAGIRDDALLTEDLEDAIFRLWVRGARRARLVVGPDVPGRDMFTVQEILEKAGFAYSLMREKASRRP